MFCTMTSTVSVAVPPLPSLTVSLNVRVEPLGPTLGAVNVGIAVLEFDNATLGPAVWFQE